MKVSSDRKKLEFVPVELNITLESMDEIYVLFSVFNYTVIVDFLEENGIKTEELRRSIDKHFENDAFEYRNKFRELDDSIKYWAKKELLDIL